MLNKSCHHTRPYNSYLNNVKRGIQGIFTKQSTLQQIIGSLEEDFKNNQDNHAQHWQTAVNV